MTGRVCAGRLCRVWVSVAAGRRHQITMPLAASVALVRGWGQAPAWIRRRCLGDGPGAGGAGKPEREQAAQVEPSDAVVQPLVVARGSAEPQSAVTAGGQPG